MTRGTRVTSEDIETGETLVREIVDDYVVVTDGRYFVAYVTQFKNGTVQITLKKKAVERK